MRKEQLEFVAMMGQELPGVPARTIGELCQRLMALARKAQKNAEDYCNVQNYQDKSDEILEAVWSVINHFQVGGKIRPRVTGDPRGYCLKLHTPNKRYNTWGGEEEGYGVPC